MTINTYSRLNLDFSILSIYNKKRFPNLAGIKEHGTRCSISFDKIMCDKFNEKFDTDLSPNKMICIYQDGGLYMVDNKYDYGYEEWYEQIVKEFNGDVKDEIISDLNVMLINHNVRNNNGLNINTYDVLMHVLKTTDDNLIMF